MYHKGKLAGVWSEITELSLFGASIKKKSSQEAERFEDFDDNKEAAGAGESIADPIVWATSGRRPSATINSLRDRGYLVHEIDPLAPNAVKQAVAISEEAEKLIVVTNLKHGKNYGGGADFAAKIKKARQYAELVIFTSVAARTRRGKHIRNEVGTKRIATNEPELDALFQEILSE